MHEIAVLKIDVTFGDGRKQELVVDSESALIGSGAHCEVRLPVEDAAVEQLEVRVAPSGLFGRVRSLERPVFLQGVPFVEGRLFPESVLEIGSARVALAAKTSSLFEASKKQREKAGNRVIHVLAAIGFPLGLALLFTFQREPAKLPEAVAPPALFANGAERCQELEPGAAAAFGTREFARALAERERAPFDGGSGVRAVRSFERAAVCLRASDGNERAEEARRNALLLKRDVENEFHVHHVRLERALATKRYDDARREIGQLVAFVGRRGGEYGDWLLALDRNLELKFSGRKQK